LLVMSPPKPVGREGGGGGGGGGGRKQGVENRGVGKRRGGQRVVREGLFRGAQCRVGCDCCLAAAGNNAVATTVHEIQDTLAGDVAAKACVCGCVQKGSAGRRGGGGAQGSGINAHWTEWCGL
jgi:hypothetical protein